MMLLFSEGTLSTNLLSQSDAAKRTLALPYTTHISILSLMSWATLSILGEVKFILISNNCQDDDHDLGGCQPCLQNHPEVSGNESMIFSDTLKSAVCLSTPPFVPHCRPPLVWFPSLLSKLQMETIQDPSGDDPRSVITSLCLSKI